jgi:GAF domain-containing protein
MVFDEQQPSPPASTLDGSRLQPRPRAEAVQKATYQISLAASSANNLPELFQLIHRILGGLMPTDNFYFALYDPQSDLVSFPYYVDQFDQPPQPYKPANGLTEYVLRTGEALLSSPEVFHKLVTAGEVEQVGSPSVDWLGVPLKIGDRIIGVMVAQSYTVGVRFGEEELNIAMFVSSQVAMAIDRKRSETALFRRAQELAALFAVATACAEVTTENALIERFTEIIGETLYPDKCGVLLLTPQGDELYCHPSYRGITTQDRHKHVRVSQGITGNVAATGVSRRVYDVSLDPDYIDTGVNTSRSELCLPLKLGERVIGVLNAESLQPGAFVEADEHLLAILAGQLSNAIERLRSEAIERKQARQLATIHDISQEILGSSLEPEKVYLAIHHAVSKLMPTEAFLISILDSGTNEIDAVYRVDKGVRYPSPRIPYGEGLTGYVISHGVALKINDLEAEQIDFSVIQFGLKEPVRSLLAVPMRLAGGIFGMLSTQSYLPDAYTDDDLHLLELLTAHAGIALGNAKLFAETLQRADELAVLAKVSSAMRIARTRVEMLPIILNQLCDLLKIKSAALVLLDPVSSEFVVESAIGDWTNLTGTPINPGVGIVGETILSAVDFLNVDLCKDPFLEIPPVLEVDTIAAGVPLLAQNQTIGVLVVGSASDFTLEARRLLIAVADIAATAIHRTTLHEQTLHHAEQMAIVSSTGRALAETLDVPKINDRLARAVCGLLPEIASVLIFFYNNQADVFNCEYAIRENHLVDSADLPSIKVSPFEAGFFSKVIHSQQPLITSGEPFAVDGSPAKHTGTIMYVPVLAKGEILGIIRIQGLNPYSFSQADAEMLTLVGNNGAIAIENARLFKETENRLRRLAALRAMDMTINSSFDLRVTLNVLLDQVATQLEADAASVLLFNPYSQSLDYSAGRGFYNLDITRTRLRLGEELAGKTALERRLVSNYENPEFSAPGSRFRGENFISYFGAPLVTKGSLKGVLEVFYRRRFAPDLEWVDYLETLAGDIAIAIDNTALFTELQRSNNELTVAYDSTLEGWSRLLELRKLEPEGHTQRVVELTVNLGEALGLTQVELTHLHRGALLHDIGKIGLPESILLKDGPLTTKEWDLMHQHPFFAYDMLSPIAYLRPALEIPYCHHEKWDGAGYPRGLKENQIPLSARIFAVIDVWDAMRSERPYRQSYTDLEVLDYIRAQSGKHFDPQVVQAFLRMIQEE